MTSTCVYCGKIVTYTKEQEEAAMKKLHEKFGPAFHGDAILAVCHDCYKQTDPDLHPDKLNEAKQDWIDKNAN